MAKGTINLTAKTHPPAEEPGSNVVPLQGGALPAHLLGMAEADAGKGVSTDQADNVVPIIIVLQGLSPQVQKRDLENYVPGAEPGDILLKGAPNPLIKGEEEGFIFQPCWFGKCVNEWIPKNADGTGGGFVARHSEMPKDGHDVEFPDPNGGKPRKRIMSFSGETEYVETRLHAGFAKTKNGWLPYIISLSSTGHQTSREWMPLMQQKRLPNGKVAPSWCAHYKITSRMRKRGQQTWFILSASNAGPDNSPLWASPEDYARGKALFEAFESGAKQAEAPHEEAESQATYDAGSGGGQHAANGEEIPF